VQDAEASEAAFNAALQVSPPARLFGALQYVVTRSLPQLDPLNIITLGRFAYFKHR